MLSTLLAATVFTLTIGSAILWARVGAPNQGAWPEFLLICLASVLPGVLWILKRQGRRAVPAAAIFVVVMLAALVYIEFRIGWSRGLVEF